MRNRIQWTVALVATLMVLGGCGGIESRSSPVQYTPMQQTPSLPAVEAPAWNSIEIIFLRTEIVRADGAPRSATPSIQKAGAGV
jgi:hypothetical protein